MDTYRKGREEKGGESVPNREGTQIHNPEFVGSIHESACVGSVWVTKFSVLGGSGWVGPSVINI